MMKRLQDAREQAKRFDENALETRLDLRNELIVTIDPATARDFDDAISLTKDDRGYWTLGVHIADVSHFVTAGLTAGSNRPKARDKRLSARSRDPHAPRSDLQQPREPSRRACSIHDERIPRIR